MTPAPLFVAMSLTFGAAALWATRGWTRAIAYTCLVASCGGLWLASLGLPSPMLRTPDGTLAGYILDEPRAIYVWIRPKAGGPPVAYTLPWDISTAQQLGDTTKRAKQSGGTVRATPRQGDRSGTLGPRDRGILRFYAPPVPAMPPKEEK